MNHFIIYRGVSIFDRDSLTEKNQSSTTLLSDGMLSSAVLYGGLIEDIDEYMLVQSLLSHVSHTEDHERAYRKRSDYISFSLIKEKALAWAAQVPSPVAGQDLGLYRSKVAEATRYVAIVEFREDLIRWNPSKSLGIYEYCCTPAKRSSPLGKDPVLAYVLKEASCHCHGLVPHKVCIVNVEQFLREVKTKHCTSENQYQYNRAMKLAFKQSEVALLPAGVNPKLGVREAQIPHADFWNLEYYIKSGECR